MEYNKKLIAFGEQAPFPLNFSLQGNLNRLYRCIIAKVPLDYLIGVRIKLIA